MAKTTPDMIIQLNVSAPGLEAAITALTDVITKISGNEAVISAGSTVQVAGADVISAAAPMPTQQPAPAAPMPTQQLAPAAPMPTQQPAPAASIPIQQPAPAAPMPTQQPAPAAPAPQAATEPSISLETICNAGAKLVEQGQMNQVIQLLGKYGVQAVNQIKPEQFSAFAADLRALGAQI